MKRQLMNERHLGFDEATTQTYQNQTLRPL